MLAYGVNKSNDNLNLTVRSEMITNSQGKIRVSQGAYQTDALLYAGGVLASE